MPLYISIRFKFYNGIVRLLCHSTHFLLIFVCRVQSAESAVNYLSKSDNWQVLERAMQSDRIVDADKYDNHVITLITAVEPVVIIHRQRSRMVTINRTRIRLCHIMWERSRVTVFLDGQLLLPLMGSHGVAGVHSQVQPTPAVIWDNHALVRYASMHTKSVSKQHW